MSKNTDRLALLALFTRIVERGSISKAATDLNVSAATASRQLSELEKRLGVTLITRNTRTASPTSAGKDLLEPARHAIASWDTLSEPFLTDKRLPVSAKVVAPVALGQELLFGLVHDFMQSHDNLKIDWQLEGGAIDFYASGCDLWICLGPVQDDSLIVKPAGVIDSILVSSPAYIKEHSSFQEPADCNSWNYVALTPYWTGKIPMTSRCGKTAEITPLTNITSNNLHAVMKAVTMGYGFTLAPSVLVHDSLKSAQLSRVLPEWESVCVEVNLVYAKDRYRNPLIKELIDHLADQIPTELSNDD